MPADEEACPVQVSFFCAEAVVQVTSPLLNLVQKATWTAAVDYGDSRMDQQLYIYTESKLQAQCTSQFWRFLMPGLSRRHRFILQALR